MKPILIEVIAPMLASLELSCIRCGFVFDVAGINKNYRDVFRNEYPDDWKMALCELSEWIRELSRLYKHRVKITLIDAFSPLGLWKQIRHRVFRFPAFIVNKKKTYVGWSSEGLESVIDKFINE